VKHRLKIPYVEYGSQTGAPPDMMGFVYPFGWHVVSLSWEATGAFRLRRLMVVKLQSNSWTHAFSEITVYSGCTLVYDDVDRVRGVTCWEEPQDAVPEGYTEPEDSR